jgi:hypothetical protein
MHGRSGGMSSDPRLIRILEFFIFFSIVLAVVIEEGLISFIHVVSGTNQTRSTHKKDCYQ